MEKRRERILSEARAIIAQQGFDALNIRDLAESAGVTVPTIYNLIGNKEALLNCLMLECLDSFAERIAEYEDLSIRDNPQIATDTLLSLFNEDEDYFRSAALACEKLDGQHDMHGLTGLLRKPLEKLVLSRHKKSIQEGLLLGDIPADIMVNQMITVFQPPFREWVHKVIDLQELHRLCLLGNYISLAADACPEFKTELLQRIKALQI
ncbi:MAG: hypothetical protein AseanaTS_05510 [Candidatus Pelagadaptatus aseana]